VLLVSHNLGTVASFCQTGLLLEKGKLAAQGSIEDVVRTYVRSLETAAGEALEERRDRSGEGRVRLTSVKIDAPRRPSGEIVTGESLTFTFAVSRRVPGLDCAFGIYDASGNLVADFTSIESSPLDIVFDLRPGSEPDIVVCEIDELLLLPGRYRIDVGLYLLGDLQDQVEGAAFFTVGPGAIRGRPVRGEATFGIVQIPHVWKFGEASARRSGARVS
jgi:lipopolysaccharide transport system ATP-binding protein